MMMATAAVSLAPEIVGTAQSVVQSVGASGTALLALREGTKLKENGG